MAEQDERAVDALSDAEIGDLADNYKSSYTHGGTTFDEFDWRGFAAALLAADRAKRAVPVAWRMRHRSEPGMLGHYPWSYIEREPKHPLSVREYEALYASPPASATERAPLTECTCPFCGESARGGWTDAEVRLGRRVEGATTIFHCRMAAD